MIMCNFLWRPVCLASYSCFGFSYACTDTDFPRLAVGSSSGMEQFHSLRCWGVLEFWCIVSWILTCISRRTLRCFMSSVDWPLLRWPSRLDRGGLVIPRLRKVETTKFPPATATHSHT